MADEVLVAATRETFDYKKHMDAAAAGDETAVRELFLFTRHTDAAAAIGHGVALVDLFQAIGEEKPARVATTLSPDDRQQLTHVLEAGVAYGFLTGPEEFPKRYPGMAAALRPARFPTGLRLLIGACILVMAFLIASRRLPLKRVRAD